MAEILFDPDATIAVENGKIDVPHEGSIALHTRPIEINSSQVNICSGWNGSEGCVFHRNGLCEARIQAGFEEILPFVSQANSALERTIDRGGESVVPQRHRRMWKVNHILEEMVKRRRIPLGYNRNRTISINCPENVFRGDVFVDNETA